MGHCPRKGSKMSEKTIRENLVAEHAEPMPGEALPNQGELTEAKAQEVLEPEVNFTPELDGVTALNGRITYDAAEQGWIKATVTGIKYARLASELAFLHWEKHGDLVYCQRFIDAIDKHGKNYIRRTAFLRWLAAYSPVAMTDGKLHKNDSPDAVPFNTEAAMAAPFWDFDPEPRIATLNANDVIQRIQSAVKRMRNDKTYKLDAPALDTLNKIEKAVSMVERPAVNGMNAPAEPAAA